LGVVSGVYYNRRPPYHIQAYKAAEEEEYAGMYWPLADYPGGGLDKADAVGAGCLVVRSDVFTTLEEVWVERVEKAADVLTNDSALSMIVSRLSPWFEFLDRKGEDMYFSERLRDIGQEIWVNYDVKCAHNAVVPIVEDHWLAIKAAGLELEPVGGMIEEPEVLE
jgi:hypothetical protein